MPIYVYLSQYEEQPQEAIFPKERAEEIASCTNPVVRMQKTQAWRLLQTALLHAYGISLRDTDVRRNGNGKWVCSQCHISLSHAQSGAAVALSRSPVGIDREDLPDPRLTQKLFERILCGNEREKYGREPSEEKIARLWTGKESFFKSSDKKIFKPWEIDTTRYPIATFSLFDSVVSVAGVEDSVNIYHVEKGTVYTVVA